ncbi:cold shock domain-containing protein [Kitasatospora sp. RB6PN24]|uniref:cold-shock protein n=1 Tax=Kitasatospora humi TaxID=2893891 RepID=UPI001E2B267F|nr:cold shock domain-containing protein [Kitasatospora humi]MCC9308443.1 cold shock domain-containing protein [Kitasatospora humi]
MVAGRVVRFDGVRGYGFIAPDHGGEDVFLHVNDVEIPESYLRSGLAVEFEVENGDRGLKASGVRLAEDEAGNPITPPLPAAPAHRPEAADSLCDVLGQDEYHREVTEALLSAAPSLTGAQILQIRAGLAGVARKHGWLEG